MRGRTVLFGGFNGTTALADTWEWDGTTWTQRFLGTFPSLRNGHKMVFDSTRQRVLLHGGWESTDLWAWNGTGWSSLSQAGFRPSGRSWHGVAYDAPRDRLLLFAIDPAMADAVGMRTRVWNGLIAVWLGLAVGLAMRATGLLYSFGCLVLPPLAATALCRESAPLFWVAPLLAVACSAVGFILANHFDLPPAQLAVALQAGLVAVVWGVRRGGWGGRG